MEAETRKQILETVDRLARERVAPRAAEIDAMDTFPATCTRPRPNWASLASGYRRNTAARDPTSLRPC